MIAVIQITQGRLPSEPGGCTQLLANTMTFPCPCAVDEPSAVVDACAVALRENCDFPFAPAGAQPSVGTRKFRASPPVQHLLGTLAVLLLAAGCHPEPPDPRQVPPLVRIAEVAPATEHERAFTGVVTARTQSDLGFRVSGKIIERLVDSGQRVTRGQPLMRIDTASLELATAARVGSVNAARARAVQAGAEEQRFRQLLAVGTVPALAYEQRKMASDAANAELKAALAQAELARNETSYATLHADADGVVVATPAEPGQVVAAGQPVVRLAHAGPREAAVDLPETVRPPLGTKARARIYGSESISGTATLRQLSDAANPATRTFEARFVLEGDTAKVAPIGSTVTILLPDVRRMSIVEIPLAALADNGQGPGVWVIRPREGGTALVAWRPVKVAMIGDESVALLDGLSVGERFVAMGAHLLHAGDQVRLAAHDGTAAATTESAP